MPLRNYHLLMLVAVLSLLCHLTVRRTHSALIVGDAIDKIEAYYVDPVDQRELVEAALAGLNSKLDEHSQYIPPKSFEQFDEFLTQEFAGVGIMVEQPREKEPVRVITPLVDSPALRAGLLPDDRILTIDGKNVSKMPLSEVSDLLRGPVGTKVVIEVRRDGKEKVTVEVTRAQIPLESVVGDYRDPQSHWVFRLEDHPRIAMIRCTSFGEKTVDEMRSAIASLDGDFDGLILDLRGNSGGLLNAAVDICDMFITDGEIVSTRGRDRTKKESSSSATARTLVDPRIPMAVLIDGNSASASEIVAACLQDHDRAAIVGTRSYGKGTVQNVLMMEYGRSALKLTTARYYRPSGKNIHRKPDAKEEDEWGVMPDAGMVVELSDADLKAIGRRWMRARYPVWKDREVTSLSDIESTDDVLDPLDPPIDLTPRDEKDQGEGDLDKKDQDESTSPDATNEPADAPENTPAEATTDVGAETPLVPDGPLSDPQMRRAFDYLQEQISGATKRRNAA